MTNKKLMIIIILMCILGATLIELGIMVLGGTFLCLGVFGLQFFPFLTKLLK